MKPLAFCILLGLAFTQPDYFYGRNSWVIELSNSNIKVGVDANKGCAIGLLNDLKGREPSKNLVNTWDYGRWIQASYYGNSDRSNWNGKPWLFNPVQVGSWKNKPGRVISCYKAKHDTIISVVHPRHWASEELVTTVKITTVITLLADTVKVKVSMTYTGSERHQIRNQEIPAAFFDRSLSQLVYYSGGVPWANHALTRAYPGGIDRPYRPKLPENWAAYINPSTNRGVGIYSSKAGFMTSYRVGNDGSNKVSDCVYMAPLMNFSIMPQQSYEYSYFIAVGTSSDIRQIFKKYKN